MLDVLLEMPEKISGVRAAQWICTGHVVSVDRKGNASESERLEEYLLPLIPEVN